MANPVKCYAIMMNAVKGNKFVSLMQIWEAVSEQEALGVGYQEILKECPQEDGWEKHSVKVLACPV